MNNVFILIGSLFGFFSVALGAFGAHALKNRLDTYSQEIYQTAVHYQFMHTFAILIVGLLALTTRSIWLQSSGWFFVVGTIVFSGSLYALAFTGIKFLGAITPIGGLLLLIGWASLLMAALRIPT